VKNIDATAIIKRKFTQSKVNLVNSAVCDIGKQVKEIVALMGAAQQRISDVVMMNKNDSKVMTITQVR